MKVTSVPFFIPDFNLLSFELDSFTFTVLYRVLYIYVTLKQNKFVEHAAAK